ncbi:MAG: DSD1 family PLP-dependent enzyme [Acidobacteria bacterium]|nr:DSD1 family PLP-dependent enzyme [Acidobacteriota bacterium]
MVQAYRSAIGRERQDLPTPALLLDLKVVRDNITTMARRLQGLARLRPHAKSHKCLQIARLQLEAGAIGATTATVWEAAALSRAGVPDLLIANEVVGEVKIETLAQIARTSRITVAVDNASNAEALSAAARKAGSEIGVLIDIDVGMGRCGVRTEEEASLLAQRLSRLPSLQLRGVMGYEGHCVMETDRGARAQKAGMAMQRLLAFKEALASAGFASEIVSAGGTGTFDLTGAQPGVTEIQAGSYVFTDAMRRQIVPDFSVGLTVLATVTSRHQTTFVIDAGKKTVGLDFTSPVILGGTATVSGLAEEHMICQTTPDCPLRVGDRVEVIPSYCPTTVNLHDVYHVVENGVVEEIWPILARGPGRGGIEL